LQSGVLASLTVDCIDITAPGAVLVLAGNISGPGGGVIADGIHVMAAAANSFIVDSTLANFSVRHSISGFATGVQVDANQRRRNRCAQRRLEFRRWRGLQWRNCSRARNVRDERAVSSLPRT
jgi:hypothetical protein